MGKILALRGVILSVYKRKCFQSPRTWVFSISLSSSSGWDRVCVLISTQVSRLYSSFVGFFGGFFPGIHDTTRLLVYCCVVSVSNNVYLALTAGLTLQVNIVFSAYYLA